MAETEAATTAITANASGNGNTFNVGTRASPLAVAQARLVVANLQKLFPDHEFPIHAMTTTGDRDQKTALYNFGNKGLWTTQLEEKLVDGELDFVVHCLKDMPTALPEGCVLGCVTDREDPRDTLVIKPALAAKHGWKTLADLPAGSVVGTSSIRRIAQLARRYPALKFKDHRGNIQTRLKKLEDDDELSAIILAAAGLQRMDLGDRISQFLDSDNGGIMWAVGQGALTVECRAGDDRVLALLQQLEDHQTMLACEAERSVMRTLEGGCSVPIGVETHWVDGKLRLRATVVTVDGSKAVDAEASEAISSREAADAFGQKLALELVSRGADKILDEVNASRPKPAQ
ncbi:porphobilinogen deaminase, dipyromethane cofactor binding domain-containing protein [Stachybotrys elegans]|uniref:Porphobilinogen deaminase n=1 Tax=Stachybotrys elegans TaxID=80388 RepID=A0A8K0WQW4_9HYPO|nr:porphobilinogen deaminase, dipyromethane cofactor binding domain-containing protein [Stachybotrys elegans]